MKERGKEADRTGVPGPERTRHTSELMFCHMSLTAVSADISCTATWSAAPL